MKILLRPFEKLSHHVDGLLENFLVGCFIAGLRDDIHLDVKIKQPRTLVDTIGMARLIEECNQLQRRAPQPVCQTSVMTKTNVTSTTGVLSSPPNSQINIGQTTPTSNFK